MSYATLKPKELEDQARVVAARADCRAVDEAIVAYVAINDRDPRTVDDVKNLVKGDISSYHIVKGVAAGPGCS